MRFVPILAATLCAVSLAVGAQTIGGRGVLGIATSDMPPNVGVRGAWVRQVAPDSAASAAGVEPNDVIVAIDGRPVQGAEVLTAYVTGRAAGETVTLRVLRPIASGVQQLTLTATIGSTPMVPARSGEEATRAGSEAPPSPASITALDAVSWTGFVDPNEQAFSTEVPQGWRIVGGLARHTAVDPSIYLRILSPDRRTYLLIGDLSVTLFTTPSPSVFGQPAREAGAVRNYLPGREFARAYVSSAIPKMCSNVTITGQRERPDLAQGPWTRFNPQARHDGGDVTFTCNHGAEQARGIVAAATYLLPGNALWGVDFLAGLIAPADSYAAAEALIRHVIASTRLNPDWLNRQAAITSQAARAIDAQTQRNIQWSEEFLARARAREHLLDQQFESFDRIIAGTSPYVDPAGNIHQLDNALPYHWIGPAGQIAATPGPTPPAGIGWQQMREVPPQ